MLPIFRGAVLASLTFAIANSAISQTSTQSLTADEAVREALAANRDLQAARLTIDVARGGLRQAGRLANPELELDYADDFAFSGEGERAGSVRLAQKFPVTARLAREKDVASQDVAIAEAEVRNFARILIAEVQRTFYSIRSFDERLGVNRQLVESVRQVEDATARRLEAAEASPAEVSLLRTERLRLEQDAQRLIREREVAAAALSRLLARPLPGDPDLVGELDPGPLPSPYAANGLGERSDLEAAGKAIDRADAARALARSEVWEDWTAGFGYEADRQVFEPPIDGVYSDSLLAFRVTVPLPLWNRQQGRIASAEAERLRSRRSRDGLALRIEEEVRAADAQARTLRASVDAYADEILPSATETRDLFERGYLQGLVGIAELLQAQRQYNESRALYFELLGDLRQAAIALETALGTSPHLNDLSNPGGPTS